MAASAATGRSSAPCASSSPTSLIGTFEESGLRGRGGAGFSMGKKGSFLPRGDMEKYLCCNADESEPGTFKDRELMQKNPHQLIEGVAIAALAVGADVRVHLHPRRVLGVRRHPRRAPSSEAYEAGYLGKNVLGTGERVELVVHRGAGAYICGEETALLDSLEGKRGNPRLKPPFPAIQGLYGGPTLINNVETLSNVPHIVNNGADWFKSFGAEQSPGTKVVSVSGCVQRPGNYEIELGIPSREIIYDLAGGPPEGRRSRRGSPAARRSPVLTAPRRSISPTPSRRWPRPARCSAPARSSSATRPSRSRAGSAHRALLPPRVVRQVHSVPRGHQLDGEDARADHPRRGDADGPRHHRLGPEEHHRQLPLRARRLDGRCRSARWSRSSASEFEEAMTARRSAAPGSLDHAEPLPAR